MFRHVGIVVKNLELMTKFYEEIIGLTILYNEIEEGHFLEHILNQENVRAHIIKLGKDGKTIVELLSFDEYTTNNHKNLFRNGLTHFAITVKDLDSMVDKIGNSLNKPMISENGMVKVCFCKDPEENFIELVELLN